MACAELCSWTADTLPVGNRVGGDNRALWFKGLRAEA